MLHARTLNTVNRLDTCDVMPARIEVYVSRYLVVVLIQQFTLWAHFDSVAVEFAIIYFIRCYYCFELLLLVLVGGFWCRVIVKTDVRLYRSNSNLCEFNCLFTVDIIFPVA